MRQNKKDDYAVGFKQYVDITFEDILNESFVGVVKYDVKPPKALHLPVLPDNTEGKLLFCLLDMYEESRKSPEVKLALQQDMQSPTHIQILLTKDTMVQ